MPQPLLDGLMVLALLATACGALLSRDLFRAVVLFIAFGLLMALAWVRLRAPDLALAEAAIGAGLSGALLLDAVGQLRRGEPVAAPRRPRLTLLLCLALGGALGWALLARPTPPAVMAETLAAAMPDSGVSHEVTAVLLNFRGFDTFLEICVLTAAAFTSLALQSLQAEPPPLRHLSNRVLDVLVAWLAPLMLMLAFYLYWAGSKEPGGAFQAGALLAAGAVLLRLSGVALPGLEPGPFLRFGLAAGFLVFLAAGLSGPLAGMPPFTYAPDSAHLILVSVEAVLTFSIGLTLLSLFTAAPPVDKEGGRGH